MHSCVMDGKVTLYIETFRYHDKIISSEGPGISFHSKTVDPDEREKTESVSTQLQTEARSRGTYTLVG